MNKEDVAHIRSGILLSPKNEQNGAICSDVDGPEIVTLNEVNQKRKTYHHIAYVWSQTVCMNEPIYKTETESWLQMTNTRLPRGEDA